MIQKKITRDDCLEKAKIWIATNYNLSIIEIESSNSQKIKDLIEEKYFEVIIKEAAELIKKKNIEYLNKGYRPYIFPENIIDHFDIKD